MPISKGVAHLGTGNGYTEPQEELGHFRAKLTVSITLIIRSSSVHPGMEKWVAKPTKCS